MDKKKMIAFLQSDHQKLKEVVEKLELKQLSEPKIIENWTVRDILAHISAWNWEEIKAVDLLLQKQKSWYIDVDDKELDMFNRQEVTDRRRWPVELVLKEWEDSFSKLINKIEEVEDGFWDADSNLKWPDGRLLTIGSLFDYSYNGKGHEGGHAKQIVEAKLLPQNYSLGKD